MATTFNVISLGVLADMDTNEGNSLAENASALVGSSFGGVGNALAGDIVEFSAGSTGYSGGSSTAYDQDGSPSEAFRIDGGGDQTFDSAAVYNATITYLDGTTANITAVVFQDTAGNTYWAPEFSANSDQAAIGLAAIQTLDLNSLAGNNFSGLAGDRESSSSFVTCFTPGAMICTQDGNRPVENLKATDKIMTRDHGLQTIRWISRATRCATGTMTPVRISAGALGKGLPVRDLVVSQQHRMLLSSKIAERMFGTAEVLVPAKKLLGLPGIALDDSAAVVTYIHLLLDRHEIIFAEGAPTESLLTGPMTVQAIGQEALDELQELFPELIASAADAARPIPKGGQTKALVARHAKNAQSVLQSY